MRIVLVEPSRAVQRIMVDLMEAGQHEVLVFSDPRKALECIARDREVRALITGAELEGLSGIEVCAAARELVASQRALYIILMSSSDNRDLIVKALDHGADDFIRKPPLSEELRARLRAADRVTSMQQQVIRQANTDFLTGLQNRRAFFESAAALCRAAEKDDKLSAILFDIDHFKVVNDSYGHEMGDAVLSGLGAQLMASGAVAGRLGGEEFGVLIPCDLIAALARAEELRQCVRNLIFPGPNEIVKVTCSFGVAEWKAGDDIDGLLRRADLALYQSKDAGRDRVTAWGSFRVTETHARQPGIARRSNRPGNLQ